MSRNLLRLRPLSARLFASWDAWTFWSIKKRAPFLEITAEDWQRQLDVNLSGTFFCDRAAAGQMAKRRYGRMVNVSSVAGLIGPIDLATYGAAKAEAEALRERPQHGAIVRFGTADEIAQAGL